MLTFQLDRGSILPFRLERATQLLQHKQYNISEITYMVGYNDLKSFREQFKKQYGVSPSGFEMKQ
jgi:AraC-like DNA-binding protein